MSKDGLCVIVTGSASGLGAATAGILAKGGARIVVNYSNSRNEAEATAEACRKAGAAEVVVVQGDVARDEDCQKIVAAAAPWGRLDALINNAGTTKHVAHDKLDQLSAEDFQRIFAVNTIGPYQMIRATAPHLKRARGAVVNVSSIGSQTGNGSSYAYAASKAALNTLTLALARTLAPEVRVNAVLPGFVEGRWLRDGLGDAGYERMKAQWQANAALGRVSTPEEIAGVIGWLVAEASVVTGQLITADAGMVLGRPPLVTR